MSTATAESTKSTNELQEKANSFAKSFLEHSKIEIVEEGFKCKAGTVPFIALEDGELVFVQVKGIDQVDVGFPEENVTPDSRRTYERIAASYLSSYDGSSRHVRFDVISIILTGDGQAFLKHHRDAFSVGD